MSCFNFKQHSTINEEFDFFKGGGWFPGAKGASIHKFNLNYY